MQLKYHKNLTVEKWATLSLAKQLANVGSEVIRTLNWGEKGNKEYSQLAFERSLELFDLTLASKKTEPQYREISRLREAWVDYIKGSNVYQTSEKIWNREFMSYTYLGQNQ